MQFNKGNKRRSADKEKCEGVGVCDILWFIFRGSDGGGGRRGENMRISRDRSGRKDTSQCFRVKMRR